VRKAVLHYICINEHTLDDILQRTRDVQPEVRKAAFTVISERLSLDGLKLAQRIALLKDGLNDRYLL
jgi:hypothetical protein